MHSDILTNLDLQPYNIMLHVERLTLFIVRIVGTVNYLHTANSCDILYTVINRYQYIETYHSHENDSSVLHA